MDKEEIQAKYQKLHDELGIERNTVDKAAWRQAHAKVWADCESELKVRLVELDSKSNKNNVEIKELNDLQVMFPKPIPPPRDLAKEIDELKAEIAVLKSKQVTK